MSRRTVTLKAVGDIALAGAIAERARREGAESVLRHVRHLLAEADVLVANFELPFSERRSPGVPGARQHLASPVDAAAVLDGVPWSAFTLATNHTRDWGAEGIELTRRLLMERGAHVVGSGLTLEEAERPAILHADGTTIGLLAACKPGASTTDGPHPGVAPLVRERILASISAIRPKVDHVIVACHWGVEYSSYPDPADVASAEAFIDAGADVVLGHHPHTLQGICRRGRGVIAYSLGNFVTDMGIDTPPKPEALETGRLSAILRVELTPEGVGSVEIEPVILTPTWETHVAAGEEAERIRRHVRTISEDITPQRFYQNAAGNIAGREAQAWARRFREDGLKAAWDLVQSLRWRHVVMLWKYGTARVRSTITRTRKG